MSIIIEDSYSETNQSSFFTFDFNVFLGQSFNASVSAALDSCVFYLLSTSGNTGLMSAKLYAHTGTYGSGGLPTGAALATSVTVNSSSLTSSFQLITFNFTGINRVSLTSGTKYFIVLTYVTAGGGTVQMGDDETSPTHGGNIAFSNDGTSWTAFNAGDFCFYVYGNTPSTITGIQSITGINSITF